MDLFDSQHADELATLLALSDAGSFAAAGRALLRHPSVLSKRLNALERRLGHVVSPQSGAVRRVIHAVQRGEVADLLSMDDKVTNIHDRLGVDAKKWVDRHDFC